MASWAREVGAAEGRASAPLSIAVAHFSHEESGGAELDVATLLAKQLTERPPTRVVAPAAFGTSIESTLPEAREVREWAERAGVDTVVLGWTTAPDAGAGDGPAVAVRVEVRSGHSGVAIASYRAPFVAVEDPDTALDELADSILTGLGYTPPVSPPRGGSKGSDENRVSDFLPSGEGDFNRV